MDLDRNLSVVIARLITGPASKGSREAGIGVLMTETVADHV